MLAVTTAPLSLPYTIIMCVWSYPVTEGPLIAVRIIYGFCSEAYFSLLPVHLLHVSSLWQHRRYLESTLPIWWYRPIPFGQPGFPHKTNHISSFVSFGKSHPTTTRSGYHRTIYLVSHFHTWHIPPPIRRLAQILMPDVTPWRSTIRITHRRFWHDWAEQRARMNQSPEARKCGDTVGARTLRKFILGYSRSAGCWHV